MFVIVSLCSYHIFDVFFDLLLSRDNGIYLFNKTKYQKNVMNVNDHELLLLFIHSTRLLK